MDRKQAVEAVEAVIASVAGTDGDKAADIAAAALNKAYAESGLVFRIEVMETLFGKRSYENQLREIVKSILG